MRLPEKNKRILLPAIAASAAAAIVIALAAGLGMQQDDDKVTFIDKRLLPVSSGSTNYYAEAAFQCGESLNTIKSKAPFAILTPKVLPSGYQLQGADYANADRVILRYSDSNVCGPDGKRLRDGVLEVVVAPTSSLAKNGTAFINSEYEGFKSRESLAATKFTLSNGNPAFGYPSGVGTSKTYGDNDQLMKEEKFDYPAVVFVADEKTQTLYGLKAFMPMEDLVKIAESLSA